MKLTKFDIGAEIISILTKGMYPNPYDAVREYIQNAIDAKSKDVKVKVRNNTLVIQDYGKGMNYEALRKAVRVGVSDKKPGKDVGFMGIGIYSAYHLCDKLEIITLGEEGLPNKLTMDFGSMKAILNMQKEQRLNGDIQGDDLLDLQSFLENYIELTEKGSIPVEDFPLQGTRVKLTNIDPVFYTELSKFEELSDYLRQVIPLHFNEKEFVWAKEIETTIDKICKANDGHFEIVDLELQIEARTETLYRPYKDIDFNKSNIQPQKPIFYEIKDGNNFWGVAWGCMNDMRKVITNSSIRGFMLKKQGFSVGTREAMVKHFSKGHTFFDRYVGEIIVTNEKLLPNAARNDFEFSILRTRFFEALTQITAKFDKEAEDYQEWTKAEEEVSKNFEQLKHFNNEFNLASDVEKLVDLISDVKGFKTVVEKRIKRRAFAPNNSEYFASEQNVKYLLRQTKELETSLQSKINSLVEHKRQTQEDREKSLKISENLKKINPPNVIEKNYENLLELLEDLDIIPDENLTIVIEAIDEKFVEALAKSKNMYYQLLNELKTEIQQRLEFI